MSQEDFNLGTSANSGNGDSLRSAFQKAQNNFDELYAHAESTSNPHNVTTTQIGAIPASHLEIPGGVATLDGTGKLKASQKASYALNEITSGDLGFSLLPSTTGYNLGSALKKWDNIYVNNVVSTAGTFTTVNTSTLIATSLTSGVLSVDATSILVESPIDFTANATLRVGGESLIFDGTSLTVAGVVIHEWNSADTDVDALVAGTSGSLIEGAEDGSVVIGIRGDQASDGLYVIDKGDGGTTYANLVLSVSRNGFVYAGNAVWTEGNFDPDTKLDVSTFNSTYTASDVLSKLLTVDGAGSGLDADLFDGQSSTHYLDWNNFQNTPTTLAGYGITDAVNSATFASTYTAADVLSKLLTVDGAGSGLDAEFLGGFDAEYFRDASNLNAGTVSDSRLSSNVPLKDANNVFTAKQIVTSNESEYLILQPSDYGAGHPRLFAKLDADPEHWQIGLWNGTDGTGRIDFYSTELTHNQQTIWTAANDGPGSGLNADILDGEEGSFYRNASNLNAGTVPSARMPAMSGDATSTAGSTALTLATVNSNVGTFGSGTAVPVITVNGKGLITAVSTTGVTPSWSSITSTPDTLAGYGITDAQPLDATLTALAALDTSTGILVQTGSDTFAKRVIEVSNGLSLTNAGGVAGDITLALDSGLQSLAGLTYSGGNAVVVQTALDTYTTRQIGAASATDILDRTAADARFVQVSGSTMTGALTLAADPTDALHAATKQYVDSTAQGLQVKDSVRAASPTTSGNVTLSSPGSTLDGVTLQAGDRILLKNQTDATQNGIYVWTASGSALTRSSDMDAYSEFPSAFVFVQEGDTNANTGWTCTNSVSGTLGGTDITWSQFSSAANYAAGTGLTLVGTTFSLTGQALALHNLSSNGLFARTGSGSIVARSIAQPSAGITITDGDGVAGNPTLALANDLAALEGLTGTGLAVRTTTDTWAQRTIAVSGSGISVSNGDGVAGNPTLSLSSSMANLAGLSHSSGTQIPVLTGADTWVLRSTGTGTNDILDGASADGRFLRLSGATAMSGTLTLAAGTTTVAPAKLQDGVLLSTPVAHAIEWDGTRLYVSNSNASRQTIQYADDTIAWSRVTSTPTTLADYGITDAVSDTEFAASYTAADVLSKLLTVDGASSGLDADLLDGQHGGFYTNASNVNAGTLNDSRLPTSMSAKTFTGSITVNPGSGNSYINVRSAAGNSRGLLIRTDASERWSIIATATSESGSNSGSDLTITRFDDTGTTLGAALTITRSSGAVAFGSGTLTANGNAIWHAGNDGASSGLDADLLDGQHGSYYQNASNLDSGTLPAGRFPALTGDVTSVAGSLATTLATVNSNTGTWGNATHLGSFTVNGKGLVTAVTATKITPAFADIASKPDTLAGYGITDAQPLDATLTALAGATWSAGTQVLTLTGADTISLRTVGSDSGNILDKAAGDALYVGVSGTAANAALLNGQPASYYTNASNLASGTVPSARLPVNVSALADLTGAADVVGYFTGSGAMATTAFTSQARSLLDDTSFSAMRSTLGLAIGSDVQAYDAGLTSISGLTTAADKMIYTTALDTYAVTDLTSQARQLLDDTSFSAMRSTLGLAIGSDVQAHDATLTALAGATWTAGTQVLALTGTDTVSLVTVGSSSGNILNKAAGDALYDPLGGNIEWSRVVNEPTTVSGYGITDAVTTSGTQSIGGAKTFTADATFSGNVTIGGDLFVQGNSVTMDVGTLVLEDAIITLAANNTGGTATHIGLRAERGSAGNDAYLVWDESADLFVFQTASADTQTSAAKVPVSAARFISDVATGTAPLTVASTTVVTNLNADLLDGQEGSYYRNASNLNSGTVPAAQMPAHTGDVTSTAGSVALTLATVNSSVGSFGNSTHVGTFTINAKGLTTGAASVLITPNWSSIQSTPTTLAGYGITDAVSSSTYTAADVLSKLLTVDGVSSGLDADLLDGQHGTYYQNASNITAGTLSDSRLPGTLSAKSFSGQITSTVSTGTAPLVIASTTAVTNLNADLLDGQHGSYYQNASNITAGTLAAARMPALTGDITTSAGAVATTLATVNSNTGSFGNATHIATFTVNAKGLTTAAGTVLATPAWDSITSKPTTLSGYSITASDVLSTLLTVDGASSALDADLLDGQHGSYYLNASNIDAGTIDDARLPTSMSAKSFTGNVAIASTYRLILPNNSGSTPPLVFSPSETNTGLVYCAAGAIQYVSQGVSTVQFQSNGVIVRNTGKYLWSQSTNTHDVPDLGIRRSSAGVLEINNGVNGTYRDLMLRDLTASGVMSGNGALITSLNASSLASGTVPAAQMPAHTGDVTSTAGSVALTLATVNSNVGSFGNATHVATFTVNAKGLTTAAGHTLITPDWTSITSKPTTLSGYSVTASDVLSTLLTVDGASSALDADLLDGQHGSYYQNATNITAGTLADARLPGTMSAKSFSGQITSTVSTGTAPLVVASTTAVTNLNADLLDGQHGTYYRDASNLNAGTVDDARLPSSMANKTITGTFSHNGLTPTSGTGIDQILTVTDSITLSTSWQDTSVNAAELASGTYMVQVVVGTEYHSGVMSWYASDTNDTTADEIALHRAGVSGNSNAIYLRIQRTLTASTSDLKLQISSDENDASASTVTMKFRRMI